jgi:hypothetical protein
LNIVAEVSRKSDIYFAQFSPIYLGACSEMEIKLFISFEFINEKEINSISNSLNQIIKIMFGHKL